MLIVFALLLLLLAPIRAYAVCPPNLPLTASGADQINAINACAGGIGGGTPYPGGTPAQIGGYSGTNTPESETVNGDCTFTRTAANTYTMACPKSGGVNFGAAAFLGVGTGLNNAGGLINVAPSGVTAGSYTCINGTVNAQGDLTAASNGTCSGGGGGSASIVTHVLTESAGAATMAVASGTTPGIDAEYVTLNANLVLTTAAMAGMADGNQFWVKAIEPSGQAYTVAFAAGSGVSLKDNTDNGSNSAVGQGCKIQNSGWMWYHFLWHEGNTLELMQCKGNPPVQLVHGLLVSISGTPPVSTAMPTVCPFTLTFPANFGSCIAGQGTCVSCGTNPSETDVYPVKVAGTQVGQLSLSTSCAGTFTTTSGVSQVCSVGQRLEVDTPATVSGSDIAFTFGGKQS